LVFPFQLEINAPRPPANKYLFNSILPGPETNRNCIYRCKINRTSVYGSGITAELPEVRWFFLFNWKSVHPGRLLTNIFSIRSYLDPKPTGIASTGVRSTEPPFTGPESQQNCPRYVGFSFSIGNQCTPDGLDHTVPVLHTVLVLTAETMGTVMATVSLMLFTNY
jgi:hypothetical protein